MPSSNKRARRQRRSMGKMGASKAPLPLVASPPVARSVLMTYGSRLSISESAAGAGASYFFRMNSVYDPDYSGVGGTAVPYNTWSAVYLNYRVKKVTARVFATYAGGTTGTFANVILAPLAYQAVLPVNTATWKMLPYAKCTQINLAALGGPCIARLQATYLPWQVADITPRQYQDEADWTGQIGSNPARNNFIGIMIQSVGSAALGILYFDVNLTYEVEWFNPVPMQ